MEGCIFCTIAQGKMPSYTVYSDDLFTAFLDINPSNPGHLVISPKAHFGSVMEMDDTTYAKFFFLARALSLALLEYGAEGVNYLYSMGEPAGQRSPHTILHLLPRYKNDNVHLVWEPKKLDEGKFEEIRQRITSLIKIPQQQPTAQPQFQAQQPQFSAQQPPAQKPQEQKKEPVIYKLPPRTGGYW